MLKFSSTHRIFIVMCLFISGVGVGYAQQQPSARNTEHKKWTAEIIRTTQTIKPGMTRRDLLKVFSEEGGLSTRRQRKYVIKNCPYIKVDVEFSPSDQGGHVETPDDKIVTISRPYLEYSIMD